MNLTKEQLRQEYYAQLHREKDTARACKEWVEKYGELARTAIDEHFHDGSTFVRSPASESLQAILEKLKKAAVSHGTPDNK